jgi:trans-aconitate methyltransferase
MNQWNTELYETKHDFVWEYGADLIDLLAPQTSERILDLGCGTGQLTERLAATSAEVVGLDSSPEAIDKARINYPQIEFRVSDGANFRCDRAFDAVFSNAALHWMQPPEAVVKCIWEALTTGGRFVAEFGAKGNIQNIVTAFNTALLEKQESVYNPWYFPSIGEYGRLLEQQGFKVVYAAVFTRPTELKGRTGLSNWLNMFAAERLSTIELSKRETIIAKTESLLRSTLYREGNWYADYQRIRIMAIKP